MAKDAMQLLPTALKEQKNNIKSTHSYSVFQTMQSNNLDVLQDPCPTVEFHRLLFQSSLEAQQSYRRKKTFSFSKRLVGDAMRD